MRLHLVDGTFELFRAHFAKRPERKFKAAVGVAQSLLWLAQSEQVTHLGVAFDNPIESFRNNLFSGYKTSAGIPEELAAQFDIVEDAARACGAVVWSMKEFEADDALATAAFKFRDQVEQVRILTPDKDLGQCLEGRHVIQVDVIRKKEIDEAALRERRGIGPASIPDFLALIGDDADGIPGLPGFGEKTAAALLARFEHLDRIPLDSREWPAGIRGADKLAELLRLHREDALLYRTLATLRRDVPLAETLEDLQYRGVDSELMKAFRERTGWSPAS
jgi:5'-3' exonuclease